MIADPGPIPDIFTRTASGPAAAVDNLPAAAPVPAGARCQEASPQSREAYVPCLAPAMFIVQGRDASAYTMCEACADHNVRNRGARIVAAGEAYTLFVLPTDAPAPAPTAPQFTIAQVQALYLKTKDEMDAMSKRHQAESEPLGKRLELCKAWMLKYLNDQGLDNAKTEHGLCYKSNILSTTVDPEGGWDKLLTHVFEKAITRTLDAIENGAREPEVMSTFLSEPALALLNRSVNKTAVKELLDQSIEVPGVKIATVTQLNVRRS